MSLLIKALKRAEHQNGKSNGSGLALEPMEDSSSDKIHGSRQAQAASAYFAAAAAPHGSRLPAWLLPRNWSLIPATLAFAALFTVGYGYYIYLMTRPPAAVAAAGNVLPPPATAVVAASPPAMPAPAEEAKPVEAPRPSIPAAPVPAPESKPVVQSPAAPAAPERPPLVATARTDGAVNPLASSAYHALQEGRLDEAQAHYRRLAASDPRNLDAMLGLAAVAAQKKQFDDAARYYLQALEADPKNAAAQGGLLGLLGSADPLAAESRLKQLLATQPSAFLHFTLGNLYAEQGKWAAAEQAYFQAQQLEPGNADYAFNLAVSLEHLNQPAIALTYYRRAQQFASRQGNVHFDPAVLTARISQLSASQDKP